MNTLICHNRVLQACLVLLLIACEICRADSIVFCNVNGKNNKCDPNNLIQDHLIITFHYNIVSQPDTLLLQKQARKEEKKIEKRKIREARQEEIRRNYQPIPNPNHADFVLLGDNLPRGNVLWKAIAGRVPGVTVSESGNIRIRGADISFSGNSGPLYLINGMEANSIFARTIQIEQVDRIEFFIGSNASMWGTRGAGGVISIYLKNSNN